MTKRRRDGISASFWLAVGIAICYGSVRLSVGNLREPGPGFFSFLAGAVLGLLSLVVLIRSARQPAEVGPGPIWADRQKGLKMVWVVVALVLFVIVMNYLGFSLATLLFLGFLLRGIEPQRWRVVMPFSVATTVVCWAVFRYWLNVQLPQGFIGF